MAWQNLREEIEQELEDCCSTPFADGRWHVQVHGIHVNTRGRAGNVDPLLSRQKSRAYYHTPWGKARAKAYYTRKDVRERMNARQREDKSRASRREWYAKNCERMREYMRAWRKKTTAKKKSAAVPVSKPLVAPELAEKRRKNAEYNKIYRERKKNGLVKSRSRNS